ncbi:AAA family ATPase [Streptomyces sp. NPDC006430]|uniref:AAA family ATPase n=1 Tax=Streptomyces sp. NPDC006430 TaxID=3154299 RepID=UPI0033B8CDB5
MSHSPVPVHGSGAADALHEREEELARVRLLTARAGKGTGALVVVRGNTGTGRTALLRAVAEQGEAGGMTVLTARGSAQESAAPFGVALQLFEPFPPPFPPPVPPSASAVPGPWDGSLYGAGLPARLWELLRSRAAAAPVLLAVDDVHLADAPSRRWLGQVARRLEGLPFLLAVTERWQYDVVPGPPPFAQDCDRTPDALLTLEPLGPRASAALVAAALGERVSPALLDDCLQAGAGNPLLLHALLADLREVAGGGPLPDRLPTTCTALHPGAFVGAVAHLLHSAGPETTTALRALAELHHEEDPLALLPQVAGTDPARVSGWADELTRRGLLVRRAGNRRPEFAHPLLSDAVRDSWDQRDRAGLHRRTAELLHHRGDPDEAVVRHLLSLPVVGEPWAADALLGAAAQAVRAEQPADAVARLRRALLEPLSVARRGEALVELGCLEVRDERPASARHLAQAMRLQRDAGGKVRVATLLGSALVARGEVHAALEVLAELASEFADSTDLAHAVQAATALIASHDGDSWLRVVAQLRGIEERSPAAITPAAKALLTEYDATAGTLSATEAMRRVRSLTAQPLDPLLEPYVLASAATLAQWADDLAEAERLAARGLASLQMPRPHPGRQSLLSVLAESKIMRGHYRALTDRTLWDGRLEYGEQPGADNAHLHAMTVIALTESGRLVEARRLAEAITADGAHGSWEWSEFLYARGLLRMACGAYQEALGDIVECGRRQSARNVESPVVTPWRSAAADCHVALGATARAVTLATEELRLARVWGTPRTVGRATRALAAALGGRRGLELAAEAVELLRDAQEPLPELLPALITLGRALQGGGQTQKARAVLREAAERAERMGAVRLHRAARTALGECGGRPQRSEDTGAAALTSGERRVAALAAQGYSNSAIAAMLHVAVRTVETHLTHSYRKLGIQGRSNLAGALGETPERSA